MSPRIKLNLTKGMQMTEIRCNCSHVPPTMPTARSEHLYDCPVATLQRLHEAQENGQMEAAFNEAGEALRNGDAAALAAMLTRDVRERAQAAFLRSRAHHVAPRERDES